MEIGKKQKPNTVETFNSYESRVRRRGDVGSV
jgi:hypothetical protein